MRFTSLSTKRFFGVVATAASGLAWKSSSSFSLTTTTTRLVHSSTLLASVGTVAGFLPPSSTTTTTRRQSQYQSQPSFFSLSSTTTTIKRSMSSNSSNNNDEVAKAQEAAAAYQASDMDGAGPATIFDKILSKEWASEKVYEDETVYAFQDINPQAPTHVIVIPKQRDGLTQLSKARSDQEATLGHLLFVAQQIGSQKCPEGFRIVINDGKDGAQSVYHLHIHVLGGRQMTWPPG